MPVSIINTENNTYKVESREEGKVHVWLEVQFPVGTEDVYSFNAGSAQRLTWAGDAVVEFLQAREVGRTFWPEDAAEVARDLQGMIFTRTGYEWTPGDINQELRKLIGSGRNA